MHKLFSTKKFILIETSLLALIVIGSFVASIDCPSSRPLGQPFEPGVAYATVMTPCYKAYHVDLIVNFFEFLFVLYLLTFVINKLTHRQK